jgi:hypothetical protein
MATVKVNDVLKLLTDSKIKPNIDAIGKAFNSEVTQHSQNLSSNDPIIISNTRKEVIFNNAFTWVKVYLGNKTAGFGLGSINQTQAQTVAQLIALVETKLKTKEAYQANISAALTFSNNLTNLKIAIRENIKLIKDMKEPSDPVLGFLDVAIVQAVKSLPVIGSTAGAIVQGINELCPTLAQYVNKEDTIKRAPPTGLFTFFDYTLQGRRDIKYNQAADERIAAEGGNAGAIALSGSILTVQDPDTQSGLAVQRIKKFKPAEFPKSSQDLRFLNEVLAPQSKNLEGWFNKVNGMSDKYSDFMQHIIEDAVNNTFQDTVNQFTDFAKVKPADSIGNAVRAVFGSAPQASSSVESVAGAEYEVKLAALLLNYYYDKISPATSVDGKNHAQIISSTAAQSIPQVMQTIADVVKGTSTTINSIFRGGARDTDELDHIVKLLVACLAIVCTANREGLAEGEIKFSYVYINLLSELGYVSLYTKSLGIGPGGFSSLFSKDADKKGKESLTKTKEALTGVSNKASQIVDVYKLRYPSSGSMFTGSASVKEVAMLYVFSCAVVKYVDLARLTLGIDDWSKVRENLNSLIAEINTNIGDKD